MAKEQFNEQSLNNREKQQLVPSFNYEKYLTQLKTADSKKLIEAHETMEKIAQAVQQEGGQTLLVGGAVRDMMLGEISKDLDLEIYQLAPEKVEEIVSQFGKSNDVGKSFGVLKMKFADDINLDVALPRIDSKTGRGHKGFAIDSQPDLDITTALSRRDFTINSIALNPLTNEIFDPFGGRADLNDKRLKITDPKTFSDDPLRALRAVQFIGRFGLTLTEESAGLIKTMTSDLKELPQERILEEWKKLLLKSVRPSLGLKAAMDLDIFKELHSEFLPLKDTPQDEKWHPEGDVWTHTLMTVDKTAELVRQEKLPDDKALVLMLGAICHDLGKPLTTKQENGRYISPNHQQAGVEPTKEFLKTLGADNLTKDKVVKLVAEHLAPALLFAEKDRVTDGAIRRLAKRLYPATIYELVLLAKADHLSRPVDEENNKSEKFLAGTWLLERAKNLAVENKKPADIIRGKDLIELGLTPGPAFSKIIALANQLRDEHNFTKEQILNLIQNTPEEDKIMAKLKNIDEN